MLWPLLLELADKTKLSDIHIHSDHGIAYREFGDMVQLDHMVEEDHIHSFLKEVMDKDDYDGFLSHCDADFFKSAGLKLAHSFTADAVTFAKFI